MRDLMVPGQRQAYEQRKKDHIARSQKAEEIRKAAQLRQNARIAQREAGIPLMVAHELEESTKSATNIAALIIQAQQEEPTKLAPKIEAPIKLASNGHMSRMAQAREASIKLVSITIPTFSKDYSAVMKEYMGRLHPSVRVKFASHTETQRWIITALLKRSFEQKDNTKKDEPTKLGVWLSQRCWLLLARKYAPDVPLPSILTEHEKPENPDLKTLLNMFMVILGLHEPNAVANMYMFFSEAWCVERGLDLGKGQGVLAMMKLDWWKRRGRDGLWYDSV
jgi:hypothetical protein